MVLEALRRLDFSVLIFLLHSVLSLLGWPGRVPGLLVRSKENGLLWFFLLTGFSLRFFPLFFGGGSSLLFLPVGLLLFLAHFSFDRRS